MALGAAPVASHAQASGLEWSGSGFMTLAAGKVLGGNHEEATDLGYRCPCFIADYAQNGVYEDRNIRFAPDSRLGLQGSVSAANGRYSLTGQVVSRGSRNGAVNLEWLYATAELSSTLTLQVGRKRLPLFVSSEVQDVGYALPWVHLPPQIYGWEIVNYNGANLLYRDQWGAWSSVINVFAGREHARDVGYWQIYNGKGTHTDVKWSGIVGAEAKFGRDWFEARVVHVQSTTSNMIVSDGETEFSEPKRQRIYGLSFTGDFGDWFGRSELLFINRAADYGRDYSQLFALGYRMDSWQPLVSFTRYQQRTNADAGPAEGHNSWSFVLRRELSRQSALKVQLDFWQDHAAPGYASMHGDSRLITVAYDRVF